MQSCLRAGPRAAGLGPDTSRPGFSCGTLPPAPPAGNWLGWAGHGRPARSKLLGLGSLSWQFGEIETGEGPGFRPVALAAGRCSRSQDRHLSVIGLRRGRTIAGRGQAWLPPNQWRIRVWRAGNPAQRAGLRPGPAPISRRIPRGCAFEQLGPRASGLSRLRSPSGHRGPQGIGPAGPYPVGVRPRLIG